MASIIQIAGAGAAGLGGLGGVLAYFASRYKTKTDYEVALRQITAKAETDAALNEHNRHQDELSHRTQTVSEWKELYEVAASERDRWQHLFREEQTSAEVLRSMWGQFETTLDDVVERERMRWLAQNPKEKKP